MSKQTHERILFGCIATFVLLGGCRITSTPTGGSYKSAVTQTALRLAMHEAFYEIKIPEVNEKNVSFSTIGFDGDMDDVREYLRMLGESEIRSNGGKIVSENAAVDVQLIVHTCGVDKINTYVIPIWQSTEELATVDMDIAISHSNEKPSTQKNIRGQAKYIENTWLLFIATPGSFQIQRDGSWVRVDDAWSNWKTMFTMPFGLESVDNQN